MPSTTVSAAFIATVIVTTGLVMWGVWRARGPDESPRQTGRWVLGSALVIGAVALASAGLVLAGFFADLDQMPPRPVFLIAPVTVLTLAAGLGRWGRRMADGLSWAALIGFQAFRIPVELVLHGLYGEGIVPARMTYVGWNFDIVTGVVGAALAIAVVRGMRLSRPLLWAFNIGGLLLLLNIVGIAVLSIPTPVQVFTEPPANTVVLTLPYVWLASLLVPFAMLGHIVSFRKLRAAAPAPAGSAA